MPIALLHRIAREHLPFAVTDHRDVDFVRILVLAGHVKATIPSAVTTSTGAVDQPAAVVTAITPLGRRMLQHSFGSVISDEANGRAPPTWRDPITSGARGKRL